MKVLVVSAAPLLFIEGKTLAYAPYVNELSIWSKYAKISFACVEWKSERELLVAELPFEISHFHKLQELQIKTFQGFFYAIWASIFNILKLFKAMRQADHIHLRCPGNIGLLGCLVQIFFPHKKKSAKYAGNWDPKSRQPLSYRLQKWILSNTFLTRNMQVLVYGEWPNQTKNIRPFFTATYRDADRAILLEKDVRGLLRLMFVGTLSAGKRPMYALEILRELIEQGQKANLDVYGEGVERTVLEAFIEKNNLHSYVTLHGNQNETTVKNAYQQAHFLLLPSKSEGWPKVVAEAMFWGCVPVATPVSCVAHMLEHGNRGILLTLNLQEDSQKIVTVWTDPKAYNEVAQKASRWSQSYTLDLFEAEIEKILYK